MGNSTYNKAQKNKNNEFYTRIEDIENELEHYKDYFKGKVVLCNCDDPRASKFFHYFSYNFEYLGLKKLITTCYQNKSMDLFTSYDSDNAIMLEYYGDKNGNRVPDPEEIGIIELNGNGSFDSPECLKVLDEADVVVTNPPFSELKSYIPLLNKHKKDFLIIGSDTAFMLKDIFPMFMKNEIWTGMTRATKFTTPDGSVKSVATYWYTNIKNNRITDERILYKNYNESSYERLENYDAINIENLDDIPMDYKGAMAVPPGFVITHDPSQFEILGLTDRGDKYGFKTKTYTKEDSPKYSDLNRRGVVVRNGERKKLFAQALIRKI